MKKKKRNKKATTSANVMAGTRLNSEWLNRLTNDYFQLFFGHGTSPLAY